MKNSRSTTAILIIHGIGQQLPFETLDSFTAPLWNEMEQAFGKSSHSFFLPGHHRIAARNKWIQNYISISDVLNNHDLVDVYEYYWAYKTQRTVDIGDIVDWLVKTSNGARKYYKENKELAAQYDGRGVTAFRNNSFKSLWYLKQLGWLMKILSFFPGSFTTQIAKRFDWILMPLNPIFRWIKQSIVDFIGDIVAYTSIDINSKFYNVRISILEESVAELTAILENPKYDQVIVAGHSLGSVIAYDTLNRINQNMNLKLIDPKYAKKIKGFVTFGSPLDKIAFFFREHTPDSQYLRRQILNNYHSFKARVLYTQPNPKTLTDPFQSFLDHVYWINFWDPKDVVSGHLDFYRVDLNMPMNFEVPPLKAHMAYWDTPAMYEKILQQWKI